MGASIESRLQELLDIRDEEIRKLERETERLQRELDGSLDGWNTHEILTDPQTLPVPRLELVWTPLGEQESHKWYNRAYQYRLVRATSAGIVAVPLGSGILHGGAGPSPPVYSGKFELPPRLGHDFIQDMDKLNLPGFILCEGQIQDISSWAGRFEHI